MTLTTDTEQARPGASAPLSNPPAPPDDRPSAPQSSAGVAFGWLAVVVVVAAAIALALVVLQSAGPSTRSDRVPPIIRQLPQGVPGSADAAERWLTAGARVVPRDVPRSADAADRWLTPDGGASDVRRGVPGSADAADRWLTPDGGR